MGDLFSDDKPSQHCGRCRSDEEKKHSIFSRFETLATKHGPAPSDPRLSRRAHMCLETLETQRQSLTTQVYVLAEIESATATAKVYNVVLWEKHHKFQLDDSIAFIYSPLLQIVYQEREKNSQAPALG